MKREGAGSDGWEPKGTCRRSKSHDWSDEEQRLEKRFKH